MNTAVGGTEASSIDETNGTPICLVLLPFSGREKLDPFRLDTAAGEVGWLDPTAEKIWNVELRRVLAFDSLSEDTKADVAKYGNDTKPEGMLHGGSVFVVADELASEAYPEAIILHRMRGFGRFIGIWMYCNLRLLSFDFEGH